MTINRIFYNFLFLLVILSCGENRKSKNNLEINRKIETFLDEDPKSRAKMLLELNEIDSAKKIYSDLLKVGDFSYYYDFGNYLLSKNDLKGLLYLDSGAILGETSNAVILAFLYENGSSNFLQGNIQVNPDKKMAIYYFRIASERGDPLAQLNLGMLYYDSTNNNFNLDSAEYFLLQCINNSKEDEEGSKDVAKDYYNKWFLKTKE